MAFYRFVDKKGKWWVVTVFDSETKARKELGRFLNKKEATALQRQQMTSEDKLAAAERAINGEY